MRCIIYSQSPRLPSLSLSLPHLKHKHRFTTPKHLCLSTHLLLQSQYFSRPFPLATTSTVSSLALAFDSQALASASASYNYNGELSVLIPTSALLFFAYWVTNFVVPDIISRYLGLDKRGESDASNANNPLDDEKR